MVDLLASEYSWTVGDIEDLTYRRIKALIKAIRTRREQDEYIERCHIGLGIFADLRLQKAAQEGMKEITLEYLIGKPPGEKAREQKDETNVEQWKKEARERGLRASN